MRPSACSSAATRRAAVVWLTLSERPAASVLPVRATARKWRRSFQSSMRLPSAFLQIGLAISLLVANRNWVYWGDAPLEGANQASEKSHEDPVAPGRSRSEERRV